jgi:hypothetical protein
MQCHGCRCDSIADKITGPNPVELDEVGSEKEADDTSEGPKRRKSEKTRDVRTIMDIEWEDRTDKATGKPIQNNKHEVVQDQVYCRGSTRNTQPNNTPHVLLSRVKWRCRRR